MRLKNALAGLFLGLVMAAGNVYASIIFITPAGSTAGGQPVNAMATFTFGTDTLEIVLQNLQGNPKSIIQALSDLEFTLGTAAGTSSLTSSSGLERTIVHAGRPRHTDWPGPPPHRTAWPGERLQQCERFHRRQRAA